ncbi:MAG: hypothetical protein J5858_09765 [Lentisphaeria bacterium]|nr:hypothetical protein [Lentisphaeria bacterium]
MMPYPAWKETGAGWLLPFSRTPACAQVVEIRRLHPVGRLIPPIVGVGEAPDRQPVFAARIQLRFDLFLNINISDFAVS